MTRRNAFTLIELLVVIGIILVVAGLVLPMALKSYRSAGKQRAQADLTTITVAINAFKDDFGDIPRPESSGTNAGFACLGRYLIGPYGTGTVSLTLPSAPFKVGDCYYIQGATLQQYVCTDDTSASAPAAPWASFSVFDGKDGPGMKKPIGGAPLGPYLQPEKFKTNGLAVLDHYGHPILYFPASPAKPNIHVAGGYATVSGSASASLYNLADGEIQFRQGAESVPAYSAATLAMLLGDDNHDGTIGAGETEKTTAPFILWSAGPDGMYGPARSANAYPTAQQINACDDVGNF